MTSFVRLNKDYCTSPLTMGACAGVFLTAADSSCSVKCAVPLEVAVSLVAVFHGSCSSGSLSYSLGFLSAVPFIDQVRKLR